MRTALVGAAVLVVAGILVAASLTRQADTGDRSSGPVPTASAGGTRPSTATSSARPAAQQTGLPDMARRIPGDPMALGRVDAPVVMVEYADFRCPYCGVFARRTKPELMRFVEDGTLRIEFRDMAIFGTQSTYAANAGRAAAAQDRFWQFYNAIYAEAPPRGHADLNTADFVRIGRKAEIPDMDTYVDAIKTEKYLGEIAADQDEARSLGANSTPAFLINDVPILGAQPTDVFVRTIEKEAQQ